MAMSRKNEQDQAKALGGTVTKGSGNGADKMDIKLPIGVRIERKDTGKKSFRVTYEDIEKIENICLQKNEVPLFEVCFTDGKGTPLKTVCLMPSYFLDQLIDLNQKRAKND